MSEIVRHSKCGRSWRQRGNRTGHCAACHETFEGEALFDAHRRDSAEGQRICLDPREMAHRGVQLAFVDEPGTDGSWRAPMREGVWDAMTNGGME